MKKTDKSTKSVLFILILFIGLMAAVTFLAWPFIVGLLDAENQKLFQEKVASLGIRGWLMLLGIQVLQIIVAFIPGEPVEVLAGILYGGFGGLFICLVGCILATSVTFSLTKRFGKPFLDKVFKDSKVAEYSFLKDSHRLDTVIFILFLIPGTPKDMLTYVAGTTSISLSRFLIISTFARIPSIISSTFIGATMRQGAWEWTLILFILTAAAGILGIHYKERMIAACKRVGRKIRDKHEK